MKLRFARSDREDSIAAALAGVLGNVVVMPYVDLEMAQRCGKLLVSRAGTDGVLLSILDTHREGFIAVVNRAFEMSESAFFGYVGQDAFPGRHWLALAIATLQRNEMGLLGFNDGKWLGRLASFGIASSAWAKTHYEGAFFYPGYERHFADVELTVLAMSESQYCYNPNSVVVEVDWTKDARPADRDDRLLYASRKAGGFDGRVRQEKLLEMFS